MRLTAACVAILLLSGCAEGVARAVNLGTTVADAGQGYLEEIIVTRQQVRAECWRMVQNQVRNLEAQGRHDEARRILARAYPPLSIVQAIEEKDSSKIAQALNEARPCLVETDLGQLLPSR